MSLPASVDVQQSQIYAGASIFVEKLLAREYSAANRSKLKRLGSFAVSWIRGADNHSAYGSEGTDTGDFALCIISERDDSLRHIWRVRFSIKQPPWLEYGAPSRTDEKVGSLWAVRLCVPIACGLRGLGLRTACIHDDGGRDHRQRDHDETDSIS
jgi:hypothetical protein